MGTLAVRLQDRDTGLYLDSRATVTLDGIDLRDYDERDSTYNPNVFLASDVYSMDISHPDYNSITLTVEISVGGVRVSGQSGAVVVVTVSVTKDIVEVEMETIYTLINIEVANAKPTDDPSVYRAIMAEEGYVELTAMVEPNAVSPMSPSVFLWCGETEPSNHPGVRLIPRFPFQSSPDPNVKDIALTVGKTTLTLTVTIVGFHLEGKTCSSAGDLGNVQIDFIDISYLYNPGAPVLLTQASDGSGNFMIEGHPPAEDVVARFSHDDYFPVEIPMRLIPGGDHELKIELKSATHTLIISGAGHGINTDNRDGVGNWTVADNPYHDRSTINVPAATISAGTTLRIGHAVRYYTEHEGTGWVARETLHLFENVSPNLYSTRNASRTAQQTRDDVNSRVVLMSGGQPDPADWRRSVLWHLSQEFPIPGGPFEYLEPPAVPTSCIFRNQINQEYSFDPVYEMGEYRPTDYSHTKAVADYTTHLALDNPGLEPVLFEFHTNAGGGQRSSLYYRKHRDRAAHLTGTPVLTGVGNVIIGRLATTEAHTATEDWQVTYSLATNDWEVVGSVSGAQANRAVTGVQYTSDNDEIGFLITTLTSASAPAADIVNIGDGTMSDVTTLDNVTITEPWTVTYDELNDHWYVEGSLSGVQIQQALTDQLYFSDNNQVSFTIHAGDVAFGDGDRFTFETFGAANSDRFDFSTVAIQRGLDKPTEDERFAQTVVVNIKETLDARPVDPRTTQICWQDPARRSGVSSIYHALSPTIAVETAFGDNRDDLALILSEDFQKNIALGTFRGVRDHYYPRLRGRLVDSSSNPLVNVAVYITTANAAPALFSDAVHSTVTDHEGNFSFNLESGTDCWFWARMNGSFQALNPAQMNITENHPPLNLGVAHPVQGTHYNVNVPDRELFRI